MSYYVRPCSISASPNSDDRWFRLRAHRLTLEITLHSGSFESHSPMQDLIVQSLQHARQIHPTSMTTGRSIAFPLPRTIGGACQVLTSKLIEEKHEGNVDSLKSIGKRDLGDCLKHARSVSASGRPVQDRFPARKRIVE